MTKIIPIDIYNRSLMVHFGKKEELLEKLEIYGLEKEELDTILDGINDLTMGRTVLLSNNALLMWMPHVPMIEDYGTLAHEVFHCVDFLMTDIGVPLTKESNEAYAYLIGYITKKVHELIKQD